jgi:hypothetical protein
MNDLSFASQRKQPWKPIPGTSQELALDSRADITFYHGARGPGKTDTQLMRFYRRVGMGYGPFWRGIIFDREYKNLDDLVSKSKRWFNGFDDGARFLSSSQDYKWVWPTGEELLFRSVKKLDDYWNFHGQEFPFIGWNELCKYPDSKLFDRLMSTNRTSFTPEKDNAKIPPLRCEVFATGNPYGPGHGWVKQRFIDPVPNGHVLRTSTDVFDPKTQQRVTQVTSQVAIFGSYKENIYLDKKYVADLENIKDENIRRAWLLGDWDIVAGGALIDVWKRNVHVVPDFRIPFSWRVDRCMDWGSSKPAAVVWVAEADGTEATLSNGKRWCPPRGSLICFDELYTNEPGETNTGRKLGASKVAELIKAREIEMMTWQRVARQPWPGPADNQIRTRVNIEGDDIETMMARVGVRWTESDKSPGSRKIGLQLMRDRLQYSIDWMTEGEARGPGLFFTERCRHTVATVPMLPRDEDDPDDVDTEAEDHLYDAIRYRVLAGSNRYATNFKFTFAH